MNWSLVSAWNFPSSSRCPGGNSQLQHKLRLKVGAFFIAILSEHRESIRFERVWGIEPQSAGWKPAVMPLYDTRDDLILAEKIPASINGFFFPKWKKRVKKNTTLS